MPFIAYLFSLSLFLSLSELLLSLYANASVYVTIRVRLYWHPWEEVDQSVVTEVLTHLSKL